MVISVWCAILVAVLVTVMARRLARSYEGQVGYALLAVAGWVGALLVVIACGL